MKTAGTFLGRKLAQTNKAIWLWEQILSSFEFERLVEVGTYKGNMSFYFFLYCLQRKKEFLTYDVVDWQTLDHKAHLKNRLGFNDCFRLKDVFDDLKFLKGKVGENGKTVVFCDGGNKVREFNALVQFIKVGDVIAVHDVGTEVDLQRLDLRKLRPIFSRLCDEEGMTRFYERYI